jgi:hypothetical protein
MKNNMHIRIHIFIYLLLNSYGECIFVSGECIDNDCSMQAYGSCTHPCIDDEEEESCVYDECAKYTEETCLTQTERACDLASNTIYTSNNNNNNKNNNNNNNINNNNNNYFFNFTF